MSDRIIVSRHPAAVEFIARELADVEGGGVVAVRDGGWIAGQGDVRLIYQDGTDKGAVLEHIPVLTSATADDVRGKIVCGNLPLHLAALCREWHRIEITLGVQACLSLSYPPGSKWIHNKLGVVRVSSIGVASAPADSYCGKLQYEASVIVTDASGKEWSCCSPHCDLSSIAGSTEYTLADMDAAGARLAAYTVTAK